MTSSKAPCSNCSRSTFHRVLHSVEKRQSEVDPIFGVEPFVETYELIECAGCGRISLSIRFLDLTTGDGSSVYYPSPISRKHPHWVLELITAGFVETADGGIPSYVLKALGRLFLEVYEAVQGGQYRLAAMGIRALLEQVMVAKVGDQGTFGKNLEAFVQQGYISLVQRDAVSAVLDFGHATTHRRYKPTVSDINTALDIVEGVVAAIFFHSEAATELSDRVPSRQRPLKPRDKD